MILVSVNQKLQPWLKGYLQRWEGEGEEGRGQEKRMREGEVRGGEEGTSEEERMTGGVVLYADGLRGEGAEEGRAWENELLVGGSELGEIRDGREGEENREGSWDNIPHERNRRIGGGSTEPRESVGQERSRREEGEHYPPSMTRGEQRATESNISSSIRSGPKQGFPRLLEEEEEEDYC